MNIGRFYLKEKKYTAALNRFKIIIENYSMTKFTPEALHRMVEAYYEMGMIDESVNTASILGHNYPESEWYKYSYNLIKNIEEDSLLKKLKKFFNLMTKDKKEEIIKRRLQKLAKSIEKHNNYYHNLDRPKITDAEYDKLVKENNELEKKFSHLVLEKVQIKLLAVK